jgi:hypothetical protein
MSAIAAPVEVPLHRRPAVRWAAGIVAAILALNLVAIVLDGFFAGPQGRPSSSYATTSRGLAAYAELLDRLGHPVTQLRRAPTAGDLPADATVVLLDPATAVGSADVAALRAFVAAGGRLVAGGADTGSLASALAGAPVDWVAHGARSARADGGAAPAGVRTVLGLGRGGYRCAGALVGPPGDALLCGARGGRVLLLADSSPLSNALLDRADNAALGSALAGPRGRPVVFVESVHGYHGATGLAALPASAWWAIGLLGLAAATYLLARWRRLGPAVLEDELPAPPRREHVDAIAAALLRTRDAAPAAARLRGAARAIVARRAHLGADAGDAPIERAARALGLRDEDVALLIGDTAGQADLIGLGRLLAHLRTEGT